MVVYYYLNASLTIATSHFFLHFESLPNLTISEAGVPESSLFSPSPIPVHK